MLLTLSIVFLLWPR